MGRFRPSELERICAVEGDKLVCRWQQVAEMPVAPLFFECPQDPGRADAKALRGAFVLAW